MMCSSFSVSPQVPRINSVIERERSFPRSNIFSSCSTCHEPLSDRDTVVILDCDNELDPLIV